jgi:hypothetical protein
VTTDADRYKVPELVIDLPSGPSAVWYPNVRVVILTHRDTEITLTPAEIRALYNWVELHELR